MNVLQLRLRLALLVLWLASCSSLPPGASLARVETLLRERAALEPAWPAVGARDAHATARIEALLAGPLATEGAVELALLAQPRLATLRASLGLAEAELLAALRWPVPRLHGELLLPSDGGRSTLELGLESALFELLRRPARRRLAEQLLSVAQLRLTADVLALLHDVRRAQLELGTAEERLALETARLEAAELAFELTGRLHAAGNVRDLDLALAATRRAEAALTRQARLEELQQRQLRLAELVGLPERAREFHAVASEPAATPADVGEDELVLERNLELEARRTELARLAGEVERARGLRLVPNVTAGVTFERESDGAHGLGPTLEVPLDFLAGESPAERRAAAALERAQAEYATHVVELRAKLRATRLRLESATARIALLREERVPRARELVAGLELEHASMQTPVFTLLDARRALLAAEDEALVAARDLALAAEDLAALRTGLSLSSASMSDAEPQSLTTPSTDDHP